MLVRDRVEERHADRVRVVAPAALVLLHRVDDPVLPLRGVTDRGVDDHAVGHLHRLGVHARGLVRNLVEHVREVVHGVDDLADVGLLQRAYPRVEWQHLVVDDRGDRDVVDVVARVERMSLDVVGQRGEVEAEAFEEHHRHVDASRAGRYDTVAQALEVRLVELRQVELGLAVLRFAGTDPCPRLRRHAEVHVRGREVALELLPPPEADEVVAVRLEKGEVRVVVEALGLRRALGTEPEAVVEVVVDVRTGEVHDSLAGVGRDREVARIDRRDDQRTMRAHGYALPSRQDGDTVRFRRPQMHQYSHLI